MKVGDLVKSLVSCRTRSQYGIVVRFYREGAMILWSHGEIGWHQSKKLEVTSAESR